MEFVKADKPDTGKKFTQVTKMLAYLSNNPDEPIPFDKICSQADAKYPQDVQAAMFALELTGLVDRYTYVESGSTRSHVAYQWAGGNGSRPTSAASSGSKKRSPKSTPPQAKAGKQAKDKAETAQDHASQQK